MINSSNYYEHLKQVYKRTKDNRKPVNQIIYNLPKELKGKKFEITRYLRNDYTRSCPFKFEDIPQLYYQGQYGNRYHFSFFGTTGVLLIAKTVDK